MGYLDSAAIRSVDYDSVTQELTVTFTSGGLYIYYEVPAWKYAGLMAASSAGQYFSENIRDQHSSSQ